MLWHRMYSGISITKKKNADDHEQTHDNRAVCRKKVKRKFDTIKMNMCIKCSDERSRIKIKVIKYTKRQRETMCN